MTIWRMAMRVGSQGPSMFEKCRELGVAAIAYREVEKIDFSKYSEDNLPAAWYSLTGSAPHSLRRLVFRMEKGDIIYVKHGPQIVGRGVVMGPYKYMGAKITDRHLVGYNYCWWSHTVPVKWDKNFKPIEIRLGAEQPTILRLDGERLKKLEAALGKRAVQDKAGKIGKDADKDTDKSTAKGRGRGQGYRLNADENRAVEEHAMKAAVRYFKDTGYAVKDTSATKPYDLTCKKGNQTWYVEVKGTTGRPKKVLVTRGEVEHARRYPARTILVIVHGIRLDKNTCNTSGGKVLVQNPWRPKLKDLEATAYRYTLPEKQKR